MPVTSLIFEILCNFAMRARLDPINFDFKVEQSQSNQEFDVELIYRPTVQHRKFKLYPHYAAGAVSEYMIKHQIMSQVEIFIEDIKPREEWYSDQN